MSENEDRRMRQGDERGAGRPPWELPAELKAFEARLAALSPCGDRLDRDRLMFLAGRAAAEAALVSPQPMPRHTREHKAWPAAFAAMTAVAATLLVMLVTRPTPIEQPIVHVADSVERAPAIRSFADERPISNSNVLSTADARRRDIEHLLLAAGGDVANVPVSESDRATLTPTAWRQIIDGPERIGPRTNDASHLETNQGATS
jgi:hypothetical protein